MSLEEKNWKKSIEWEELKIVELLNFRVNKGPAQQHTKVEILAEFH